MQKRGKIGVFGQCNGDICERTGGDEPQLARVLKRRRMQRVPGRCIVHHGRIGDGKLNIAEAVMPVEGGGDMRLTIERLVCATVDGITCADQAADAVRVEKCVIQQRIAADSGNSDEIDLLQCVQRHERNGVINAGIAIEPDRVFVHASASL